MWDTVVAWLALRVASVGKHDTARFKIDSKQVYAYYRVVEVWWQRCTNQSIHVVSYLQIAPDMHVTIERKCV